LRGKDGYIYCIDVAESFGKSCPESLKSWIHTTFNLYKKKDNPDGWEEIYFRTIEAIIKLSPKKLSVHLDSLREMFIRHDKLDISSIAKFGINMKTYSEMLKCITWITCKCAK